MSKTKMTVRDFTHLAGSMPSFYASLFSVSPRAANALETFQKATDDLPYFMTDRAGDSDEDGFEIPEGQMHTAELGAQEVVTEEHLREKGYDLTLNETLSVLREELENGTIKPGTVPYTVANYTIDALEKIRRREYVPTPVNLESKDYPGFLASQKIANYSFTPKLDGFEEITVTDNAGKEHKEYRYPEGFAEDAENGSFFVPRENQRTLAKYSAEELDESAKRINFDGITSAASDYMTSMRQINNMIGMQAPETPEQDRILREHAMAAAQRMRMEIRSAMAVSPDDPVALRFFGDIPNQLNDTISSDPRQERALVSDLAAIDSYIEFLGSGLPISSFTEYQDMRRALYDLEMNAATLAKDVEGMSGLQEMAKAARKHLKTPPQNMDEETRARWFSEVRKNIGDCVAEYERITGNLKLNEDVIREGTDHQVDINFKNSYIKDLSQEKNIPADRQDEFYKEMSATIESDPVYRKAMQEARIKDFEKKKQDIIRSATSAATGPGRSVSKIKSTILPNLDKIGKKNVADRKAYITEMLGSIADDMGTISKELEALAKKSGNMTPELKAAIDKAVTAGDPKRAMSPDAFVKALNMVQAEAITSGNSQITEFVAKNKAYLGNRMEEAKSKGILMDESLNLQRSAIERNGKDDLDNAIRQFNTRRSSIFGGWRQEQGKESPEHKELREAAEKYSSLKKELMDKKELEYTEPETWKQLSKDVQAQAEKVSGLARTYFTKKGLSANSPAGKARLDGSIEIYRDAEMTRIDLKRREAAAARYEEIGKATGRMLEANAKREAELEIRNEGLKKQEAPKVRDISLDDLMKKVPAGGNRHEFHGRSSVGPAPSKQAPEMQSDSIRRSNSFG